MQSPLAQPLLSSLSFDPSSSLHHDKSLQTTTSSSHSSTTEQHISSITSSQATETYNTTDTLNVQENSSEQDDRVHQINGFLSRLLDNVQEESQEPLLSLDAPSSYLNNGPTRELRKQCVNIQQIDVEDGQDENECPSKSAPSPSVGTINKSSPESSFSSSEDEIVTPESPTKAEDAILMAKDILEFSTVKIDFGANFPGMTIEECLEITNKSTKTITVQLSVDCLNTQCQQQIQGYVYGLRRSLYFDIKSQHELVIGPHCSASLTVVLKSPRMKVNGDIAGEIVASVQGAEGVETIGLSSSVYIPQVVCPKELYNHETKCSVINLAISRKNKKLDTKFSLKNLSEIPVTLQLSFYQPKNVEEDPDFDCLLFPSTVTIPAQGMTVVGLGFKKPKAIAKRADEGPKSIKKVLVGTMRGSALIYSFLLCIELY